MTESRGGIHSSSWEKEQGEGNYCGFSGETAKHEAPGVMEAKMLRRQPDLERSGEKSGVEKEFAFDEASAYGWVRVRVRIKVRGRVRVSSMRMKLTTENM